jgi:hypothetical protein
LAATRTNHEHQSVYRDYAAEAAMTLETLLTIPVLLVLLAGVALGAGLALAFTRGNRRRE